ncbi:MAG: IS701 family transposase, partial [Trichodesmium sp. St4_bin8_1]|nr:IS701 family transposase [Trichodesmium sp. St4_bin8_1]
KDATEIDYLITNKSDKTVTGEWIVTTFCQRDYIQKFYRKAKGWLGLKEYQMRHKTSLIRHFILVFVAYIFIIYQQLMGSRRKGYAHKLLTNFTETLEAFLTGISDNFFCWLQENQDVVLNIKQI